PVCLSGLGCTTSTGPDGDRQLGDFFRIQLDRDGRALIAFDDGNNQLGQEVPNGPVPAPSIPSFVRQATGPSLFASVGEVPAIPRPLNFVTGPSHHNPVPFAAPTGPGPDVPGLNLMGSTTAYEGNDLRIDLTLKTLDLTGAITAPALPNATYLTRWWYNGKLYFAAAEDNGGQLRYFAGEEAPVTDVQQIKYQYYPAATAITGSTTGNVIQLKVPGSVVGNPKRNDTLYTVTSYALTHAAPTAPTPPTASNLVDFPQIADVLPSYNVGTEAQGVTAASPAAPSASPTAPQQHPALPNTGPGSTPVAIPLALLAALGLGLLRRSGPARPGPGSQPQGRQGGGHR
ncbi:MAG: hypothetical protein ACYDGR_14030, partial [Candidatus Dormibacteria bacterium]